MRRVLEFAGLTVLSFSAAIGWLPVMSAQARTPDAALIARRNATEAELESIAIIERKVMVPMRDAGRHLSPER